MNKFEQQILFKMAEELLPKGWEVFLYTRLTKSQYEGVGHPFHQELDRIIGPLTKREIAILRADCLYIEIEEQNWLVFDCSSIYILSANIKKLKETFPNILIYGANVVEEYHSSFQEQEGFYNDIMQVIEK